MVPLGNYEENKVQEENKSAFYSEQVKFLEQRYLDQPREVE